MYLKSKSLVETLSEKNNSSESEKASSLVFLRRHIDESLKNEHLTVEDPSELWKSLKDRYDHQKEMMLPKYRDAWNNLRFQDFKKVNEYNSTMFSIISYLKYCGDIITDEQMIEKTLSTFHASNIVLQQQYRLRGFKEYTELITNLMVAEEYNELLIKNHLTRPTGSQYVPETNFVKFNKFEHINFRGRGRGRGRGGGRGNSHGRGRGGYSYNQPQEITNHHKRDRNEWNKSKFRKMEIGNSSNTNESVCFRCGSKEHWAKTCRADELHARLYKEHMERIRKGKEVHFVDHPTNELTQLKTLDYHNDFDDTRGKSNDVKEVHYVDREKDPIDDYTYLGGSSFDYDLGKNSNERGDDEN